MFYHGTSDILGIKHNILPPIQTGNIREEWRKKYIDKIFVTTSLLSAMKFAKKASAKYGGKPVIYQAKPIGEIWHVNTNEYVADKAIVIGKEK